MKHKLTFKTTKPTGRYKAFDRAYHEIKVNGYQVGTISDQPPHRIRLQVIKDDINEDGMPNCVWKWITLAKENESVHDAKEFVKLKFEIIMSKYKIHIPNEE